MKKISSITNLREPSIFTFKVSLKDTKPLVWRSFEIMSHSTFYQLHMAIQTFMGWQNYHLFSFTDKLDYRKASIRIVDLLTTDCIDDLFPQASKEIDANDILISNYFKKKNDKILYEYDFGDSWIHEIALINISPIKTDEISELPKCLDGRMACPPEDCGGPSGFHNIKNILRGPKTEDYNDTLDWLGGIVPDFEFFSVDDANNSNRLSKIIHDHEMDEDDIDEEGLDEDETVPPFDLIGKSILLVQPKQPYKDFVNKLLEELPVKDSCSSDSEEESIIIDRKENFESQVAFDAYINELKPTILKFIIRQWTLDQSKWPSDLSAVMFDEWFNTKYIETIYDIQEILDDELDTVDVSNEISQNFFKIVDAQLQSNDPKETNLTLKRLLKLGIKEKEARSMIVSVLACEMFEVFTQNTPFNTENYIKLLNQLPNTNFLD